MKVAHPQVVSTALLEEEAVILQQLDHPHIAKLLAHGIGPRGPYIAMELCAGGDMFDCLSREGTLSEPIVARVMRQLLEAVEHMHSCGIYHRDLKEENLLLTSHGPLEELHVKVCDFGISRSISGMPSSWASGLCTPSYAAPEVLVGEEGAEAADVWSCGVIMYSLLSGRQPFEGNTRAEMLTRVCSGGPSFQEAAWSGVSEGATGLIRRLLQVESTKRYTVQQILAHPWIARQAPLGAASAVPVSILAEQPSAEQMEQLGSAIRAFESAVLPWELSDTLRRVGITEDVAVASQLAAEAAAGNGCLDCSALVHWKPERRASNTLLGTESFSDVLQKNLGGAVDLLRRYSSFGVKVEVAREERKFLEGDMSI